MINRTGHTFIKSRVKKENAVFAGEASGHYVFNDFWYGFDDGIYTTVRLLTLLSQTKQKLSELLSPFPELLITPEIKLPIAEQKKLIFIEKFKQLINLPNAKLIELDGLRYELPSAWGLVRPSNTSPYIVLRFEADDVGSLNKIQAVFKTTIEQVMDNIKSASVV